jgi:hypothetical protein
MSMSWQLVVVFALVALAAAYVAWHTRCEWTSAKKGRCGGGCGCAAKPAQAADQPVMIEQLSVRERKPVN